MYENKTLASTGVGFSILGTQVSLGVLVIIAATLVVLGVVLYRVGTRRRRYEQ